VPFNVGERGSVQRVFGLLVSENYFQALGLRPAQGRFFGPSDGSGAGNAAVVVISHGFWRTRFSADPDALGRSIRVNDQLLTVVGVTPERFQGTVLGLDFDLWVPAAHAPALLSGSNELEDRSQRGYTAMGLLPRHATRADAQAEADRAMRELASSHPSTNRNVEAEVLPFWQAPRGPQRLLARALMILQGLMLLLLLAACANTGNLMLARASARQHEIGVRLALGAGPWRIVQTLMAESMLLALMGAGVGVAIAAWGTTALRAVPFITAFPVRFQTGVDLTGLAFAVLLALASGALVALAPAVQLARTSPLAALRSGVAVAGRSRFRQALMAVEVALAQMVLIAAGLFYQGFQDARDIDPGFRREGVLLAAYDLGGRNLQAAHIRDFTVRLLERLRALPGVEGAAIASSVPLDIHGLPLRLFTLEGRARSDGARHQALTNVVTPGYFATMGIELRAGTGFAALEDPAAPMQAVVNEEFVRRTLEGGDPIGRILESGGRRYAVAGVAANSISEAFGEPPTPVVYLSSRDRLLSRGEIHVRARAGAEMLLAPQVERIVRALDPALPVHDIRSLNDHIEKNLFLRRIPARMFAVLGPALLLLAAIGIYAVVAYAVAHRTKEIGVRLALGARPGRLVAQIVGESMRVIAVGAAVGWAAALLTALHLVRRASYAGAFGVVPAVLLAVAAAACWLPARRAAARDPLDALRNS
jgi:predicted permease